jgi:hypothetical protein
MKNTTCYGIETMLDTLIDIEYNALMIVEKSNGMTAKQLDKATKRMRKKMKKAKKKAKATEKSIDNFYDQVAKVWG